MKIAFIILFGSSCASGAYLPGFYPLKSVSVYSLVRLNKTLIIAPKTDRIFFYNGYPSDRFAGFPFCELRYHSSDIVRSLNPYDKSFNPMIVLGVGSYDNEYDYYGSVPRIETYDEVEHEIHEVWLATDGSSKLDFRCVGLGKKNKLKVRDFRNSFGDYFTLIPSEPMDFFSKELRFDLSPAIRERIIKGHRKKDPSIDRPQH